jgi:coenzyme F420-0:L-glutamate ligase/coenzyme F420-1:gamma-L-glutamate ligase
LLWDVIRKRRSIRQFEPRPVSRELIEKLLQAAILAPNAHNRQSWRFVVLTSSDDIIRLAEGMGVDYRAALLADGIPEEDVIVRAQRRKERICGAPVVVLMCMDSDDLNKHVDINRDDSEYIMAVQSVALAGGQMLLAAHAEGLGGVWMCAPLFAPQRVREACDLPESWIPQGMVLLGYPAEEPESKGRKLLGEVVIYL